MMPIWAILVGFFENQFSIETWRRGFTVNLEAKQALTGGRLKRIRMHSAKNHLRLAKRTIRLISYLGVFGKTMRNPPPFFPERGSRLLLLGASKSRSLRYIFARCAISGRWIRTSGDFAGLCQNCFLFAVLRSNSNLESIMSPLNYRKFLFVCLAHFLVVVGFGQGVFMPTAENTGLTIPESELEPMKPSTIWESDLVIEGKHFQGGQVIVQGANVTFRNCKFTPTSWFGLRTEGKGSVIVEHCHFSNPPFNGQQKPQSLIMLNNSQLRYSKFENGWSDAIKVSSNTVIEYNYITRMGAHHESHADGIQMTGGSNVVIRHNYFDMPFMQDKVYLNNACMMIQNEFGDLRNIDIYGNWLNGAGTLIMVNNKWRDDKFTVSDVSIRWNRLVASGKNLDILVRGKTSNVYQYGNVWDKSGSRIGRQSKPPKDEPSPWVDGVTEDVL